MQKTSKLPWALLQGEVWSSNFIIAGTPNEGQGDPTFSSMVARKLQSDGTALKDQVGGETKDDSDTVVFKAFADSF